MSETLIGIADIAAVCAVSRTTVAGWCKRQEWPTAARVGRGGALAWPLSDLPVALSIKGRTIPLRALAAVHVGARREAGQPVAATQAMPALRPAASAAPATAVAPSDDSLDTRQRDCDRARRRILDFIAAFDGSAEAAIGFINSQFADRTLPTHLEWAYRNAWDKPRPGSRLNRDTIAKWKAAQRIRGTLAPLKAAPDSEIQPWHGLLLALRQRPQGSCITWIAEQIQSLWKPEWGARPPSYHIVRRALDQKIARLDQLKGRYTGSQLRAHKFYQHRTAVGLAPWAELHADGWCTHFTAPHPVSGEFVTLEVWHAHDVATRYVPPFAVGLTENFEVIAKCVENAIRDGGVMAILQTDSTRIVKNSEKFKGNTATAIADRAGFTIVHPKQVGNSQANGIPENFNTFLDRESREIATYQGKGMDELTYKRVRKITARMVKAATQGDLAEAAARKREAERAGKGIVFETFGQAVDWLESKRRKWNDKPHISLPKIADPATGRRRHQTPSEALAEARAAGWSPVALNEAELNRSPFGGRHEARSVIHGRPVRSLATNRKPAGGG